MNNKYITQRLNGIHQQLMGAYKASCEMSSATKGSEREVFIDLFLSNVLPTIYRFGSGDITDTNSQKSGQVDVVIENPYLPSLPIVGCKELRLYLVEGVACAIEVKSDIGNQWKEVRETLKKVKKLKRNLVSYSKMSSHGVINSTSKGTKDIMHSFHISLDGTEENKSENLLLSPTVPFFAVGFMGWTNIETMRTHCDNEEVDGILCIDTLQYVSGSRFGNKNYEGVSALWHFICNLLEVTGEVQRLEANLSQYIE
ncbi:conserved hypothetical protein [Vibrio chagasii]|nr:conserved hypothetical protein [Vibrio chagasii]CAH7299911.1 conserved hypothetical protein [Vibrio chagasii]CAH7369819.1 conserved hypothetical protein [Vibrio chagasii]CAH7389405.1 conserved hypothetical protein [Vibrio chagasii]